MTWLDDERGQAIWIGAGLFFGFLVIGLTTYQAVFVPQQNEQVEFNHYEDVKNDFEQMRNAVINAGTAGETRTGSVKLGTTYPARILALNAGPPAGTLETTEVGGGQIQSDTSVVSNDVDFDSTCGTSNKDTITAKHIVYRPGYNYFSEDSEQRYENTVYYEATSGSTVLDRSGQQFIQPSSNTIELFPIQEEFSQSGISAKTVDFVGGQTGESSISTPFRITVPTQLSASQWDDLLPNTDLTSSTDNVEIVSTGTNTATFEFTGSSWTVKCHPIGIGNPPGQPNSNLLSTSSTPETSEKNGGSGSGNTEEWSSSNTGSTISQSGGILQGIGNAQNIYVKNPKFQSIKPNNGDVQTNKEYFRMVFVLEKNVSGQPTGTTRYMFVLPDNEEGIKQKIDDSAIQFSERKITIYKDDNTNNDGSGWTKFADQAQIKQNELKDWYTGSGPDNGRINLLDNSNYAGNYNSEFTEIETFMNNNEVNIYFVRMYGRIELNVE